MSLISNSNMIYEFINADEIAYGLAPKHPESVSLTASKLMLKRFKELLVAEKSFAFETTASGLNYVKHLEEAKTKGYQIHSIFLWLPSPDLAIKRVKWRVSQGGHNIPKNTIIRRYYSGIKNFIYRYAPISDIALILDNSIADIYKIVAIKNGKSRFKIEEPNIWKEIEKVSHVNK